MKKQMTVLLAAVLCTSLLAGCGTSGEQTEKRQNPQESSADEYAQKLAQWEETNEEIIKTDPLVEEISQMLIEESQSTEPVDISVDENLIRFTVKSESEDQGLLQRMVEKTNKRIDILIVHMQERGVGYPSVEIVWQRATGLTAHMFTPAL